MGYGTGGSVVEYVIYCLCLAYSAMKSCFHPIGHDIVLETRYLSHLIIIVEASDTLWLRTDEAPA